jgi:hypothetical protein
VRGQVSVRHSSLGLVPSHANARLDLAFMTANSYDYLSGTTMEGSSLNVSIAPDAPSVLSRANEFVELHDQVHVRHSQMMPAGL